MAKQFRIEDYVLSPGKLRWWLAFMESERAKIRRKLELIERIREEYG